MAMKAPSVAQFFGDGERRLNLQDAYIYHNDNDNNVWYFAMCVDKLSALFVDPASAAGLPDEDTATAFADFLR